MPNASTTEEEPKHDYGFLAPLVVRTKVGIKENTTKASEKSGPKGKGQRKNTLGESSKKYIFLLI